MISSTELKIITISKLKISSNLIFVGDSNYSLPKAKWVKRNFRRYYIRKLRSEDIYNYDRENDCDNFGTAYRFYMQALHAKQKQKRGESLAVAEIWYMKESIGGHSINMVIVEDYLPIFIEPQDGTEIILTNKEKKSCMFVRF